MTKKPWHVRERRHETYEDPVARGFAWFLLIACGIFGGFVVAAAVIAVPAEHQGEILLQGLSFWVIALGSLIFLIMARRATRRR